MRILSVLLIASFTTAAYASPVTKADMTKIVLNANETLYQTESFLEFTTINEIDHFRTAKLAPISNQIQNMDQVDYHDNELAYCRDYLKTILRWFDLMIDFKAGKHDSREFSKRRKFLRKEVDQDARNCAFILNEE